MWVKDCTASTCLNICCWLSCLDTFFFLDSNRSNYAHIRYIFNNLWCWVLSNVNIFVSTWGNHIPGMIYLNFEVRFADRSLSLKHDSLVYWSFWENHATILPRLIIIWINPYIRRSIWCSNMIWYFKQEVLFYVDISHLISRHQWAEPSKVLYYTYHFQMARLIDLMNFEISIWPGDGY